MGMFKLHKQGTPEFPQADVSVNFPDPPQLIPELPATVSLL
jgi:hypothetical protein